LIALLEGKRFELFNLGFGVIVLEGELKGLE